MTTDVKLPRLLTPRQVSEMTGLPRFRVYELIRAKRLPAIRCGNTLRISENVLRDWIATESQTGGAR